MQNINPKHFVCLCQRPSLGEPSSTQRERNRFRITLRFYSCMITSHSADSFPPQVLSSGMPPPEALKQQVLWTDSSFFKSNSSDSHLLNAEIHDLIVIVVLSLKSPLRSKLISIALLKENHLKSLQFNTSLRRWKRFICNNRKYRVNKLQNYMVMVKCSFSNFTYEE